jgi:putative inorganic carbon (hco3(-)) transporter
MATRATWDPGWRSWCALAIAAVLLAHEEAPARFAQGHWVLLTPILVVLGTLALRRLWSLPPAIPMCAAIALTIFSGAWQQIGLGGLPLDRLFLVIVLLQFVLRAPGVAHVPRPQLRGVHLLLAITVLYALGSAVAAGTLGSETGVLSLVDLLGIAPYAMFLLAPAIFAGERERNMLLMTLVGVGLYLGLTAIFESLGPHALVFPKYIVHADASLQGERAGGPFQSSLAEGFSTFACAVAAAVAFTQWRGEARRRVAAVAGGVCVFGAFLTLERGVWIAAILATMLTALATRYGRRMLAPGLLVCAVVIGGALLISPALAHRTSARANSQISIWDRQNQTYAGLRMLAARPLFGFGWERYRSDSLPYFREAADYPMYGYTPSNTVQGEKPLPLHDTYLAYAVELGLLGTLLWLASLLWAAGGAILSPGPRELAPWKLGQIAITAFFLVVAVFNPYQEPFPVLLLWVWAGVARGSEPLSAQLERARRRALAARELLWVPARLGASQ